MAEHDNSPYIISGEKSNFNVVVLENSQQGPVMVNFCAQSSDDCLKQHAVLIDLVNHFDGLLMLVNVDIDKQTEICQEYGIASVPTLKIIRNGEVKESFYGLQTYEHLLSCLDLYVARESDRELADALDLYIAGQVKQAYDIIANAIMQDADNPRLALTFCKLLKHEQRYDEAIQVIEALSDKLKKYSDIQEFYNELLFLNELDASSDLQLIVNGLEKNSQDMSLRRQLLIFQVMQNQYEEALHNLREMYRINPDYLDGYPRQAINRLINILGPDHMISSELRALMQGYNH